MSAEELRGRGGEERRSARATMADGSDVAVGASELHPGVAGGPRTCVGGVRASEDEARGRSELRLVAVGASALDPGAGGLPKWIGGVRTAGGEAGGRNELGKAARASGEGALTRALHHGEKDGHVSVLYEEVLEALRPQGGIGYHAVDCTTNGGGHSYGLLERSTPDGRLTGLDADASALEVAERRLAPFRGRYRLINRNFRQLGELGLEPVHGVVFDLGLSSEQLDASGRGFAFRFDEPLDMRFDLRSSGPTAAELLNSLPEAELERLFREYGEERRARRLASVVGERRRRTAFARTGDLVDAVTRAFGPARGRLHPATRVFQAVRIAVNDELAALEEGLEAAVRLLKPGGRLAVISFHSLEDRIVKWRFRGWAEGGLVRLLTRKPRVPTGAEIAANPQARSAKLRVAERIDWLSA